MTSDDHNPQPRLLLTVLGALWVMAFIYAFVATVFAAAEAEGLSASAVVLGTFLGWQGVATLLALATFGVSRAWPKSSAARRLGTVPLFLAGLLIVGILVVTGFAALTA